MPRHSTSSSMSTGSRTFARSPWAGPQQRPDSDSTLRIVVGLGLVERDIPRQGMTGVTLVFHYCWAGAAGDGGGGGGGGGRRVRTVVEHNQLAIENMSPRQPIEHLLEPRCRAAAIDETAGSAKTKACDCRMKCEIAAHLSIRLFLVCRNCENP